MAEQNENIQNELEFEDILPFDTTGGDTGLSSRLKLKRNFERIRIWADTIGVRLSGNFLSRVKDDTAEGRITFLKGLEAVGNVIIRGALTALEAVMNRVRSENYTVDTGFELTNDNGAGASQLTVDYIRARRKLIAESIEVKERHASAGDEIFTGATAEISRVDYLDSEGQQLGVHSQKVPFTLNGVLLMLRKVMGTSRLEPRGIASDSRAVRGALSAAERQRIARVRCYFLASDGERDVENWWAVGDLAYCMTQNLTRTPRDSRMGASEKAGNVFWWRQVIGIDADGAVTLDDGKEYHYIDFSVNYAEEQAGTYKNSAYLSDMPAPGDKCMQFGNVSNPDRMNAVMVEVNGAGNVNAPDIVFFRGIYTYSLERCWWGGESCRKAKLSPSTGWEFTGPDFKFLTEYGQARVPVDRGAWLSIPEERDVREPHDNVRKCYYFDRVTHLGSLWLCVKADDYIWLKNEGTAESPVWNYWGTSDPRTQPDYSDDLYRRVLDYTTVEPSESAPTVWQKQVAKGDNGTSPWVADLDNEMDSVACDADGHPTSEQTVTTGVSLVYGGERRAATVAVYKDRACEQPYTNSETLENGLAVYWTIGARSNHTVSMKVGSALTISGSMNFYVKITDGESGVSRLLVFTVNGVRPGPDGKPATIYNLLPSEKQVSVGRNADGTYNPATFSLTCGYVKNVGGVMTTVDNVQAKIDGKYELYYRLRSRESQQMGNYVLYRNTHGGQVPVWNVGDYDQVEFVLSTASIPAAVSDSNIIDRETVPVVADGKQGDQGNNGDDAVTVRFSRNPVVFQGNSLGQSVNTTAIIIYPVVYVGGTPVDATSVVPKSKPSGLDVTVRNVAAEWDGVDTQPVAISPTAIGVAEGALTGIVELTIGYGDNKTITGSVVTTVAHSGTSGNGVKEIFKASDTKPATPSGTDVLPAGWSEQPPVLATGLTYTVTGDWTRNGNTLTSPAATADDGVYRSRVSFTTAGKATIAVRLTVSSEENYDFAAIATADSNFLEGKTAGDIKDYSGTDLVAKLSGNGTTGVFLLTVDAAGGHYFDVVYAKDSSNDDYNDNAVLELNLETDIWVSTSKIVTDASGNETAAGWSEPVRWNGPQGKMGRNFYYDGVYDSSRTYSVTDYEAPFVSYGANYYVRVGEGSCQGVTPSAGSPYWELMTSTFKYLITMAIFSEYAKLGSWIFNGDYMFSERDANGGTRGSQSYTGMTDAKKTSGFIPTVAMDAANGRSSFSGDKVRFNPDGSGWLADGNISWNSSGNASFSGKVTATSGSIAGFQINQDYLGTQDDGYTQGFVMRRQRLTYYYGGKGVSIGTNNNQAISVTGFSGATALFTNGGDILHKLGANDSFTVGDALSVNTGETVILSKFEARGDVAIGGSVITDSSMQDYLPLAANTRKGQLLLFSSGDWEINTSSTVWIYDEDGRVKKNGVPFERTGPFMLVCVGFNSSNVALWQYFNGR